MANSREIKLTFSIYLLSTNKHFIRGTLAQNRISLRKKETVAKMKDSAEEGRSLGKYNPKEESFVKKDEKAILMWKLLAEYICLLK